MNKKNIYNLLLVLLGFIGFISCSDDEKELDKGHDVLSLQVNKEHVVLNQRLPSADAITFNWTTGSNQGSGTAISYIFQMDIKGNDFAQGIYEEMGKRVYTRVYTHESFNNALLEDLLLEPGQTVELEARIIARVADEKVSEQISQTVSFTVTSYIPVSPTLYLIGDATPGGWSADNATRMNTVSGQAGSFIWTGTLTPGVFKFITTLGSFMPSYNKDGDNMALIYRDNDEQPDEKFSVTVPGKYQVQVNIIDLTISMEPVDGPKYQELFFVGSFNGWGFTPMRQDPVNPFVFRFNSVFEWNGGGDFKFGTINGAFENMIHPSVANAPFTHQEVLMSDEGDYKWQLSQSQCGKPYKIALDVTEGEEKMIMTEFTPYPTIWMIGSATPNGWNMDDATPFTLSSEDPYLFTWTGNLSLGEMKITCDKQSDWNGAWFMPAMGDSEPSDEAEYATFVDKNLLENKDVDRKWKIPSAGSYTITLNQLTEEISFRKN